MAPDAPIQKVRKPLSQCNCIKIIMVVRNLVPKDSLVFKSVGVIFVSSTVTPVIGRSQQRISLHREKVSFGNWSGSIKVVSRFLIDSMSFTSEV